MGEPAAAAERAVLVPLDIDPTPAPAGSRMHALRGRSMGTDWSAQFVLPPSIPDAVARLRQELQAELDAIVAQMSHWEPDSLLSRYNRAPAGTWHPLPRQFFDVIDYALRVQAASGGAYDPAAGELVALWGFGPLSGPHRRFDQAGFQAPTPDDVAAVLARRAAAQPVLDREAQRLLQPGGATLDLSAVAKGYSVDRLAGCLTRHGIHHYLVEVGGELRGAGVKPDGQPWWVEIEGVPDAEGTDAAPVAALHGLAVATSGDYRACYRHAQERLSHTLDPRSGRPIGNGVASVTVLAPTCMAADALSTALGVLGTEAGLAFARERSLAARFLVRTGAGALREAVSPAWAALRQ
jgi:thiamine biosynthesis lipoprotein